MRLMAYVLGSIAAVLIIVTYAISWWAAFDPKGYAALFELISGQTEEEDVRPAGPQPLRDRVIATTETPNQVSIENVTQLRSDGTSLALVYATSKVDFSNGYGYYGSNYDVVDQRAQSLACQQIDEDALGPDACRTYPSFNPTIPSIETETNRDRRRARNALLIRPDGSSHALFPAPVTILHSEVLWGRSTDYVAVSYLDADTDRDGIYASRDIQKLVVLDLETLDIRQIDLPGSFANIGSLLGRSDWFNILVGNDLDSNGRYDPVVEPMHAVMANFRTGELKLAISNAAMTALQSQLNEQPPGP